MAHGRVLVAGLRVGGGGLEGERVDGGSVDVEVGVPEVGVPEVGVPEVVVELELRRRAGQGDRGALGGESEMVQDRLHQRRVIDGRSKRS